ncbi:hypothetical protein LDG_5390 [Legionella drancourtii LLAP12]|uniref:Uncharacterized protein n=1 Tax=Legionella drancourtii LLAP12 TaxID=658187 RepID=G9EJM4_9GAMM|nr:hypothetical protein LDG_5390 [Legionella drancourtii LLAP12]
MARATMDEEFCLLFSALVDASWNEADIDELVPKGTDELDRA